MKIILIMIMMLLTGSTMAICDSDTPPIVAAPSQDYQSGDVIKPKPPKARKAAPANKPIYGGSSPSIESAPTEDGRIPTPFDKDPKK